MDQYFTDRSDMYDLMNMYRNHSSLAGTRENVVLLIPTYIDVPNIVISDQSFKIRFL